MLPRILLVIRMFVAAGVTKAKQDKGYKDATLFQLFHKNDGATI